MRDLLYTMLSFIGIVLILVGLAVLIQTIGVGLLIVVVAGLVWWVIHNLFF